MGPDEPATRGYRFLPHTADKAIEAWGRSLPDLFAAAAEGMFAESADLDSVPREREWAVEVEGETLEDLLHAWLSELLWPAERDGAAFCEFQVEIAREGPWRLRGRARGGPVSPERPHTGAPVKAVTYHGLQVWQAEPAECREGACWRARVVFDV